MKTKQSSLNSTGTLQRKIQKLMEAYKGSARYYRTRRGYAMIAAKLDDQGNEMTTVDEAIETYRRKRSL